MPLIHKHVSLCMHGVVFAFPALLVSRVRRTERPQCCGHKDMPQQVWLIRHNFVAKKKTNSGRVHTCLLFPAFLVSIASSLILRSLLAGSGAAGGGKQEEKVVLRKVKASEGHIQIRMGLRATI